MPSLTLTAADHDAIDALIARGWPVADAVGEVTGQDPTELARQDAAARVALERRRGATSAQATRRAYDAAAEERYVRAETECRGHLLNAAGRRAGIDPRTLFYGPASRVVAYASEELTNWFETNGRLTVTQWRAQCGTIAPRRARTEAKTATEGTTVSTTETVVIDPIDLARVRVATEDRAGHYAQNGAESAARYVAEGSLSALCDRYGLAAVWQAVSAELAERPELLTRDDAQRKAATEDRDAAVKAMGDAALEALKAGDYDAAHETIDAAELISPDYRIGGRFSWDEAREAVSKKAAKEGPGEAPALAESGEPLHVVFAGSSARGKRHLAIPGTVETLCGRHVYETVGIGDSGSEPDRCTRCAPATANVWYGMPMTPENLAPAESEPVSVGSDTDASPRIEVTPEHGGMFRVSLFVAGRLVDRRRDVSRERVDAVSAQLTEGSTDCAAPVGPVSAETGTDAATDEATADDVPAAACQREHAYTVQRANDATGLLYVGPDRDTAVATLAESEASDDRHAWISAEHPRLGNGWCKAESDAAERSAHELAATLEPAAEESHDAPTVAERTAEPMPASALTVASDARVREYRLPGGTSVSRGERHASGKALRSALARAQDLPGRVVHVYAHRTPGALVIELTDDAQDVAAGWRAIERVTALVVPGGVFAPQTAE